MPKGIYARSPEVRERERLRCLEWNSKKKGVSLKSDHRDKVVQSLHIGSGEKNGNWKGDFVGYHGLHRWVRNTKGKLNKCEQCGRTDGKFQWANKSGQYKRDVNDWIRLCVRCHDIYDDIGKLISKGLKGGEKICQNYQI